MTRLCCAIIALVSIVGLTACSQGGFQTATVVWGLGYPTTERHRITWQVEGDQVMRTEEKGLEVTETSYELVDRAEFQRTLHDALQVPVEVPPCQDANVISIEAIDARGDRAENQLQQCSRAKAPADALLDALEQS